jgi:oxygen-independent coproporphyrinogen-3 oxidase
VYALSIEPGTPLEAQIARRRVAAPDDDRTADLLDWLDERLPAAGFQQYEISNWARAAAATGSGQPEFACRHNLSYWTNRPYLGLGAGAHGYAGGLRTANVRPIVEYVRRLTGRAGAQRFPITPAAEAWRKVEPDEAALDSMLLGLRLTHTGVGRGDYVARHGRAAWEAMLSRSSQLVEAGLLEAPDNGSSLRLTWRGRRLGNRVFREFV